MHILGLILTIIISFGFGSVVYTLAIHYPNIDLMPWYTKIGYILNISGVLLSIVAASIIVVHDFEGKF
jgi:hypothetical protein